MSENIEIINQIKIYSKALNIDKIGFTDPISIEKYSQKIFNKESSLLNIFPECKTVISAALSYNASWNNVNRNKKGYIAHYTTANFYKMLSLKLNKLGKFIKKNFGDNGKESNFFRVFVNSKLNDKLCSYACGVGTFSKNTLISVNDLGQKAVLGELLLSVDLNALDQISADQSCINCALCTASCPTNALKEYSVDKEKCIQHISTSPEVPEIIYNKNFILYWKKRFFGCTDCIDVCPLNKNQSLKKIKKKEAPGFIGTTASPEKIIKFKKHEYKKFFKNNQLSAGWAPAVALARNTLMLLFNLKKHKLIEKYFSTLDNFEWNEEEKQYLINFKNSFLKE